MNTDTYRNTGRYKYSRYTNTETNMYTDIDLKKDINTDTYTDLERNTGTNTNIYTNTDKTGAWMYEEEWRAISNN